MAQSAQKEKTLLSDRIPRDTEHERYHPELEEELKECLFCLRQNEMMFDLEVDTDLIEQHIYERQALLCRYRLACIPFCRNTSRWEDEPSPEEAKSAECQSLSYKERCHRR